MTFRVAYEKFKRGYTTVDPTEISFRVWFVENPMSPFHLHGSASLRDHDAIHVLLECDQTNDSEAFVIGFTMGTDDRIKSWEVTAFKFISRFLYPKKNKFTKAQIKILFVIGFTMGTDDRIKSWEVTAFKFISRFLYPKKNKFTKAQIKIFERGFAYGLKKQSSCNRLGEFDWTKVDQDLPLEKVQVEFGIYGNELRFFKGEVY